MSRYLLTNRFLHLALAILVALSTPAHANPEAHPTWESYARSGYDYLWEVIQDEFDARPFDTDSEVEQYRQLVDTVIRTGAVYAQPFRNGRAGLADLYPRLLELDPDPPLYVQYRFLSSQVVIDTPESISLNDELAVALGNVAKQMDEAGYPPYIRAATWLRVAECYRNAGVESAASAAARDNGLSTLVEATSLTNIKPQYREFVAERLSNFGWRYSALTDPDKELYQNRLLEGEDTDPWISHYTIGRWLSKQAWDARGDGWGHEVTDQQWALFTDGLTEAEWFLNKAWESRPHWPQAATELISLNMGHQVHEDRDSLFWFEEAIKARVDAEVPYRAAIYSVSPRWGGSDELMWAILDDMVEYGQNHPNFGYAIIAGMSRITSLKSDPHILLHDPKYLGTATDMMLDEIQSPLPYVNKWQQRSALRTLAMGNFEVGNYEICAELLRAGGGMTDRVRSPWANAARFQTFAPTLATPAAEQVIAGLKAESRFDREAAVGYFEQARDLIASSGTDPEIHGDPTKVIDDAIDRLKAGMPPQTQSGLLMIVLIVGSVIVVLIAAIVVRLMARS